MDETAHCMQAKIKHAPAHSTLIDDFASGLNLLQHLLDFAHLAFVRLSLISSLSTCPVFAF